ncbi:PREDICTED: uncharacterized protein LOC106304880 [Brassica oleracea var. oleracea]|uniref:uncharacterized protein LOC106304880 n=1 Tax=Brassica oleracea var. oleracea TaxID=109376 RepID=UPI0006A6A827|nr:PREDICTED: uncharacterized protein LOC106304880 [Brassica oleracea var. oleracea]
MHSVVVFYHECPKLISFLIFQACQMTKRHKALATFQQRYMETSFFSELGEIHLLLFISPPLIFCLALVSKAHQSRHRLCSIYINSTLLLSVDGSFKTLSKNAYAMGKLKMITSEL